MTIMTYFVVFLCVVMLILVFVGGHNARVEQRKFIEERAKNPSLPPPPSIYGSTKRIHEIRRGNLLYIPLYIFGFFIPFLYIWMANIPPIEELHVTSGELTYKTMGNRGERLTGIKTASSTILFTCSQAVYYGGQPNCLSPMSEYDRLSGQPATVWWYEQSGYLFSTQKRLVKLLVADKEIISYERTVALTQSSSKSAPWFMFGALVIISLFWIAQEQLIRRDQKMSSGK